MLLLSPYMDARGRPYTAHNTSVQLLRRERETARREVVSLRGFIELQLVDVAEPETDGIQSNRPK